MTSRKFITACCLLAGMSISLIGCGSKKQAQSTSPAQTVTTFTAADTHKSLDAYSRPWDKLRMPLTVRLSQPKSVSISGTATMVRGKSLTLSFRVFGMEVAVLYLTQDSLLAIDKFHKRYVMEPLAPVLGGFPVNIDNVQDLLTGRPFLLGSDKTIAADASKFDIDVTSDSNIWTMIPKKMPSKVEYGFSFDSMLSLVALIVKVADKAPVDLTYSPAEQTPVGPFSPQIAIEAQAGKTAVAGTISYNFGKLKTDKAVDDRPIQQPGSNYERIPAKSLLKIVSSL